MKNNLCFLDLFAGAGGLSEGFIQAGFSPVAHVEADQAACFTLRTRMAYHWLKSAGRESVYADYLNGNISRDDLYAAVPEEIEKSVINKEIAEDSLKEIFGTIDMLLKEPLHKSPTHVLAHACRVRQHPGLCSNLILA